MIQIRIAGPYDMDLMMESRLQMLRAVNNLDEDFTFSDELVEASRKYFEDGDQITVLAFDNLMVIGCATLCFIRMMPTYAHPSGYRAHMMNVYTVQEYRRQGIAGKMVNILIEEAWKRGATEISLDAPTAPGKSLYKKNGFTDSTECMVLVKGD